MLNRQKDREKDMILKIQNEEGWFYIDNITHFTKLLDGKDSNGGTPTREVMYLVKGNSAYENHYIGSHEAYLLNDDGKTIEALRFDLLPNTKPVLHISIGNEILAKGIV